MKDYLAGIGVILGIVFALFYVTFKQIKQVNGMRHDLSQAVSDLVSSTSNSQSKNRQLVLQFGNDDVERFMSQHRGTLQSMIEFSTINQRIGEESEALRIPIQEQKNDKRAMPSRMGNTQSVIQMHEYTIGILCKFRDSLMWLGKIQDAFPYARVVSVVYTPSGDYVSLQTKILFPIMDPQVIKPR
jgi:hypothetical protein